MIESLIRQEVKELRSYKEGGLEYRIKLDANENGWGLPESVRDAVQKDIKEFSYHRYPDSDSTGLREELSIYTGVPAKNLMVGNGSDELIQYIAHTFVGKGDGVVLHYPTFSMYGFFARLSGGRVIEVLGDKDFNVRVDAVIKAARDEKAKVVFLCNPNNPTGKVLADEEIRRVIEEVPSIVVVDEAYYEFYGKTVIDWINKYDNLIVLRTFSKAMAIGGLRVGYLAAGDSIMEYMSRVKVPYNVSSFSQNVALRVLKEKERIGEWIAQFKQVRRKFIKDLSEVGGIKAFPTQANFVLIKVSDAGRVWAELFDRGILVRKFSDDVLKDCLRVTVSLPGENKIFISELKSILGEC
jgi:histidinol-phosphate aminotransferase